jgi:aryl-alcohol dehydrogenase-like predicted oxidoreductase
LRIVEVLESAHNAYRRFEPLGRPVSRLVLGTMVVAEDVLDEWVRLGGNSLDTARVYGDGASEEAVGAWFADRPAVRDELVVLTKGAHPSGDVRRVTPADIAADLDASIGALGRPVDIYLLHRDDPALPVGPMIDCLNEYLAAGRLRAIGTSNWTCARIDEANAYAAAHGLEGFTCNSPQLSLARQNEEHWPGTMAATDDVRAWHARTQMPLFAWSAQARGFFAGHDSESAVRVYDNERNRERRRRAASVGERLGCTANQVALAWVLAQPYPVYAVIGPRTVEQLHEAVGALDVSLTDDEVRWLDLRA